MNRSGLVAIALIASLWSPRDGRADEATAAAARGALTLAAVAEILIPDVRRVVSQVEHPWALSWPIVVTHKTIWRGESIGVALQPSIEPQYQLGGGARRIAGAARVIAYSQRREFQLAPLVEAGALAATDGSGGFGGVGVQFGVPEVGIALGLVVRRTYTSEEQRYDLALDVSLPITSDEY